MDLRWKRRGEVVLRLCLVFEEVWECVTGGDAGVSKQEPVLDGSFEMIVTFTS
jgi:hypothetical protein